MLATLCRPTKIPIPQASSAKVTYAWGMGILVGLHKIANIG
jgi:hypothetical protein